MAGIQGMISLILGDIAKQFSKVQVNVQLHMSSSSLDIIRFLHFNYLLQGVYVCACERERKRENYRIDILFLSCKDIVYKTKLAWDIDQFH